VGQRSLRPSELRLQRFGSRLCRLIGVDSVREEKARAAANQEHNNETHDSITPSTSTTHVTLFCFRTASWGARNGFDAAAILWQCFSPFGAGVTVVTEQARTRGYVGGTPASELSALAQR